MEKNQYSLDEVGCKHILLRTDQVKKRVGEEEEEEEEKKKK